MQRCIEDYRKTSDSDAAAQILTHIADLEERSPQVREALGHLREVLTELEGSKR